jgi:hypothetical protein
METQQFGIQYNLPESTNAPRPGSRTGANARVMSSRKPSLKLLPTNRGYSSLALWGARETRTRNHRLR